MPNKRNNRIGERIEASRVRPEHGRQAADNPEDEGECTMEGASAGMKRMANTAVDASQRMVRSHPTASMLTSFGIGFGLGLVVTTLLRPGRHEASSWHDSSVADTLRGVSRSLMNLPQATAETVMSAFGRR